jgi:hypothetical protein
LRCISPRSILDNRLTQSGQKALNGNRIIRDAITNAGCRCTAVVAERAGVWDFAVNASMRAAAVVRCVEKVRPEDYSQLETMLTEGDFTRAFIVYTAEDQPHLSGEIDSYPLSRIDELAALLAKESPP